MNKVGSFWNYPPDAILNLIIDEQLEYNEVSIPVSHLRKERCEETKIRCNAGQGSKAPVKMKHVGTTAYAPICYA